MPFFFRFMLLLLFFFLFFFWVLSDVVCCAVCAGRHADADAESARVVESAEPARRAVESKGHKRCFSFVVLLLLLLLLFYFFFLFVLSCVVCCVVWQVWKARPNLSPKSARPSESAKQVVVYAPR